MEENQLYKDGNSFFLHFTFLKSCVNRYVFGLIIYLSHVQSGLNWHFELSKVGHVTHFGNSNLSFLNITDE